MSSRGAIRLSTFPPILALTLTTYLAGCAANPGPPPIVEQEAATETRADAVPPPTERSQVQVGVQPLRNGLNPHLVADENSTIHDIAELTLPSPFHDGVQDTDVVVSAGIVPASTAAASMTATSSSSTPETTAASPEPAMVVRYQLNPAAQWSDGSPITGADFVYLWRGMVATPGTVGSAPYRAISDIRVSGAGGKVVDVVFSQRVNDWQSMFAHLLPSHLLDSNALDFAAALADTIPASAGRYMVDQVDRGSGVITLNRNDRFWGENPATIDILTLNAVRTTEQVADRLRSGQFALVDHVPGESSFDTYSLIPGTQVRTIGGPRQLGVVMSVDSPVLGDLAARTELRSLIDVPLISRIATGRSRDLAAATTESGAPAIQGTFGTQASPGSSDASTEALRAAAADRPLRIAADPRDNEAMPAARALVDLLNRSGVAAEAVAGQMTDVVKQMRSGDIDAVVTWSLAGGPSELASTLQCSSNLSGLCTPATEQLAADILSGAVTASDSAGRVRETVEREAVWVPLLDERRILVLGRGITGPSPDLANWTRGVSSAAEWKLEGNRNERTGEPAKQ